MMEQNPEFEFVLFDDQELNNSVEEYFDKDVAKVLFQIKPLHPKGRLLEISDGT